MVIGRLGICREAETFDTHYTVLGRNATAWQGTYAVAGHAVVLRREYSDVMFGERAFLGFCESVRAGHRGSPISGT